MYVPHRASNTEVGHSAGPARGTHYDNRLPIWYPFPNKASEFPGLAMIADWSNPRCGTRALSGSCSLRVPRNLYQSAPYCLCSQRCPSESASEKWLWGRDSIPFVFTREERTAFALVAVLLIARLLLSAKSLRVARRSGILRSRSAIRSADRIWAPGTQNLFPVGSSWARNADGRQSGDGTGKASGGGAWHTFSSLS